MDLITLIFWLAVGWVLAQVILGIIDGYRLANIELAQEQIKYLNDLIHDVKVETIEDIEYWYDKDDGEFLGQGKTIDDIIGVLKSRFPSHIFLIPEKGGLARQTGWKLVEFEEMKKLRLKLN